MSHKKAANQTEENIVENYELQEDLGGVLEIIDECEADSLIDAMRIFRDFRGYLEGQDYEIAWVNGRVSF